MLNFFYFFNQFLNGNFSWDIYKNRMRWKASKISQFYFKRMVTHRNMPEMINDPFLQQFALMKTNQRQVRFSTQCRICLESFIKFLLYLFYFVTQFFLRVLY